MPISYVVLDFDGTCTQVDRIQDAYLAAYWDSIKPLFPGARDDDWLDAQANVRTRSPHVGWMLGGVPSAPAAADPFILAGEAAGVLQRRWAARKVNVALPSDAHEKAYQAHTAPFRPELRDVLRELRQRGVKVGFISNSSTQTLANRLTDLLAGEDELRAAIPTIGNAVKFKVQELAFEPPGPAEALRGIFEALPAERRVEGLRRPAYLRRGGYFEALCSLWQKLGAAGDAAAETLVCGDVWELDLALPQALGAQVHLIERAKPFDTYGYERAQVGQGACSQDLTGLLARVPAPVRSAV